ncbi:MAG: class I SAM-dependent methyltransferase [Colwelliaceae bacterium]|jgi:SAM-dependent methyltransferase|nr:class I SAM-dependent methyltransferase [Colwelliaceae bacterium]
MINDLKAYYKNLLDQHGDSPLAVQHINSDSQYKRFEILSAIDNNAKSIIDLGCGLGDMYQYLQNNKYDGCYLGLDFLADFIKLANNKFDSSNNKNVNFQVCDLSKDDMPSGYDYILLSGVFNNKMENNKEFMLNTLKKMFSSANKGIAFNAMSTYVDYQDEQLYYSDPLEVFDYCKRHLSSAVTLKHDYLVKSNSIPYEYTIYVYKQAIL